MIKGYSKSGCQW